MKVDVKTNGVNQGRAMKASGYFENGNIGGVIENKEVTGWLLSYFNNYTMVSFEGSDKKHYLTKAVYVEFTE